MSNIQEYTDNLDIIVSFIWIIVRKGCLFMEVDKSTIWPMSNETVQVINNNN